jgi:hypothetical protein
MGLAAYQKGLFGYDPFSAEHLPLPEFEQEILRHIRNG